MIKATELPKPVSLAVWLFKTQSALGLQKGYLKKTTTTKKRV